MKSVAQVSDLPEAEYVAALMRDLEAALPQVWGRKVVSVFFGGGTPSLFSARSIDAILVCGKGFAAAGTFCRSDAGSQSGNIRGTEICRFSGGGNQSLVHRYPEL